MIYVKLSAPRLRAPVARMRLFEQLDALKKVAPVTWIAGPAGGGKSTLAASWLEHAGIAAHWMTLDSGDRDPATFFHFLSRGLEGQDGASLPLYTPARDTDLSVFARRFFRAYYARLAQGSVQVFDDLHKIEGPGMAPVLEAAFAEIPQGIQVLALSRHGVPASLARMEMHGGLAVLDAGSLRMNAMEARALFDLPPSADALPPTLAVLEGWAAGLMILRSAGTGLPQAMTPNQRDMLWRYFTGELLEPAAPETRQAMLMFSALPALDEADAYPLTQMPAAADILRQIQRQHMLIVRDGNQSARFRFHPLFLEFLRAQARGLLSPQDYASMQVRAAAILEARDDLEGAAALLHATGDTKTLQDFLLRHARAMLHTGRAAAWQAWMDWLPADAASAPMLAYWRGRMEVNSAPARALTLLAAAADAFSAMGDQPAYLLALAAIIDCYYHGLPDLSPLPAWLERLRTTKASLPPNSLDGTTLCVLRSRMALGLMLTDPSNIDLPPLVGKAVEALAHTEEAAERLAAASILLHCMDWLPRDMTHWLISVYDPLAEDAGLDPLLRCRWYARKALSLLYLDGEFSAARRANDIGILIADTHGLSRMHFALRYTQCLLQLAMGEAGAALRLMSELRVSITPLQKIEQVRLQSLETCLRIQSGDVAQSLESLAIFIERLEAAGIPAADNARMDRFIACCHAEARQYGAAAQSFARAIARPGNQDSEADSIAAELVHAGMLAEEGRLQEALPRLQAALAAHRQYGRSAFFVRFPLLAARIAALALDADIERAHVIGIIRRQHLRAPGPFSANWPWPVAVRTFGHLSVALNGEQLSFSGKAQQRPLVLLKALLLAMENGQSAQQIADHLWPDLSDARASLNVTIHRLRKLLGNDEAVLVAGGRITINRSLVWSDVEALNDLCDRIQHLPANAPAAVLHPLAQSLLGLYRGHFSDGSDEAWLLAGRNRWRSRFLDAATALGMRQEALGELAAARTLYLAALEVEPLAESLYRSLMRCAHAQHDPAAAYSAYRRCRETLSVILGKRPSEETEKLAVSIGLRERAP